ncbi:amidase [Rhizobium oryzicola]|uniref:Indoleacetamide hydrolase n=1 Tax=Rhizobium oryzicola TaxID=1232668 RepID=A0ABT8SXQ8_9HYPH|nr:amidase [Rhizobium oryzicola]MDO1583247.1 amidase [Rhizobium oryzicola]
MSHAASHNDAYGVFASQFSLGPQGGKTPALTVAIKDCLDIEGMVTRCGSRALADAAPAKSHADVVANLLASGCRIVGKTRMHELAYGMTGINTFEGTPVNPRYPDRIPGGSSSGSAAAVAASLVDFAIGTDTGGSIRQPAICCGVIGFKPTFGRVSRKGALPAQSSLDCVGPFARSLPMIERAMSAIDSGFWPETFDGQLRIGRLRLDDRIETPMAEAMLSVDSDKDGVIEDIELPLLNAAFKAGMTIIARETLLANAALMERPELLGDDVRKRLEGARSVTDADVAEAEDIRARFTADVDGLFERFDVLLTPALPLPPPRLFEAGEPAKVLTLTHYLRPFNLSGHPALVLPAATSDGLPSGIQLLGPKGADARLIAMARRLIETNPNFHIEE